MKIEARREPGQLAFRIRKGQDVAFAVLIGWRYFRSGWESWARGEYVYAQAFGIMVYRAIYRPVTVADRGAW